MTDVTALPAAQDETQIRALIDRWTAAVRRHDLDAVLADHCPNMIMFDVPPPLQVEGIDAYRDTWDFFFRYHKPGDAFDVQEMEIVAGDDVAFAYALMRCGGMEEIDDSGHLDFRLTVGLRKIGESWIVIHEHHSIPALCDVAEPAKTPS